MLAVGNVGCETVNDADECTAGVWPSIPGAAWIWSPGPAEQATFTARFRLPPQAKKRDGVLEISADNAYQAYLNGELVGSGGAFDPDGPDDFTWATVFTHDLDPKAKENVLEVRVINYFGAPTDENPAGVTFRLTASYVCPGRSCAR